MNWKDLCRLAEEAIERTPMAKVKEIINEFAPKLSEVASLDYDVLATRLHAAMRPPNDTYNLVLKATKEQYDQVEQFAKSHPNAKMVDLLILVIDLVKRLEEAPPENAR